MSQLVSQAPSTFLSCAHCRCVCFGPSCSFSVFTTCPFTPVLPSMPLQFIFASLENTKTCCTNPVSKADYLTFTSHAPTTTSLTSCLVRSGRDCHDRSSQVSLSYRILPSTFRSAIPPHPLHLHLLVALATNHNITFYSHILVLSCLERFLLRWCNFGSVGPHSKRA